MSLLNNPEGIGRAGANALDYAQDKFISPHLKEQRANMLMTLGCLGSVLIATLCSGVGLKVVFDSVNATPEPTPTKPVAAPTNDNQIHYSTYTPPTETPKMTVYRVEIKRGDTIWDLVQAIEQQYPAGGSYVYINSRTGDRTDLLSRESVLKIHSIVPGDALIYFLP